MKISREQQKLFWAAFNACKLNQGLRGEAAEAFRHQILREETGHEHLGDIASQDEFDRVMARVNEEAGDYMEAANFRSNGDDRRAFLIKVAALQIMQLTGFEKKGAGAYLCAILTRMNGVGASSGLTGDLSIHLPRGEARTVFQVLNKARERLLRKACKDQDPVSCVPVFGFATKWRYHVKPLTLENVGQKYYADHPINVYLDND